MDNLITLLHRGFTTKMAAEKLNITHSEVLKSLKNFPLPKLEYSVGVEIEGYTCVGVDGVCESINNVGISAITRGWTGITTQNNDTWIVTTDGSVKGFNDQDEDDKGQEIISPPLTSKRFQELQLVLQAVKKMKYPLKTNKTCGLHVHFGKKDYIDEIHHQNLYNLYRLFEPFIDRMLPPSREFGNKYCMPIKDLDYKSAMKSETTKYWSVRVKKTMPTIEFRKHQGSTDYQKIHMWILILQQFVKHAEEIDDISSVVKSANLEYFYRILSNPRLIAYYNERWKTFETRKTKDGYQVNTNKNFNEIQRVFSQTIEI